MILHLINDEKITNQIIYSFQEALIGESFFIVFLKSNNKKNVSSFVGCGDNVFFYNDKRDELEINFYKFSKIVIHFLDIRKINFIKKYIKHNPVIYWGIWGADLYSGILVNKGYKLLSPENSHLKFNNIKRRVFSFRYREKFRKMEKFIHEKVDYIGGSDGDILLLKQYLGVFQKKIFELFAYPYDVILGEELKHSKVDESSKCILCGNSASYTNNQEYVLEFLKNMEIDSSYSIKMPLSYGGDKKYISSIIKKGRQYFGKSYIPILDFLPLNQYYQLFLDAVICVYGSWRQEAFGNIVIALYLGSKIYMSNHNPLANSLKELGFSIFIIEETITRNSFFEALPEIDKKKIEN